MYKQGCRRKATLQTAPIQREASKVLRAELRRSETALRQIGAAMIRTWRSPAVKLELKRMQSLAQLSLTVKP